MPFFVALEIMIDWPSGRTATGLVCATAAAAGAGGRRAGLVRPALGGAVGGARPRGCVGVRANQRRPARLLRGAASPASPRDGGANLELERGWRPLTHCAALMGPAHQMSVIEGGETCHPILGNFY